MKHQSAIRCAIFPLALALGCGGAAGAGPESAVGGTHDPEQRDVEGSEQRSDPAAASGQSGEPPGESTAPQPASVPTSEGDCMEFHAKMIECEKAGAAGGIGPSEEARMRASAEAGCRSAIEDSDNPVTRYVLELWARCAELPCAEVEACVQSGMTELSAPPGPYQPDPQ